MFPGWECCVAAMDSLPNNLGPLLFQSRHAIIAGCLRNAAGFGNTASAKPDRIHPCVDIVYRELPADMISISSVNGLAATARAYSLLQSGADALDAVVAGVAVVEDDPEETSVGWGGLPNEQGVVELDAACMHGPTHKAGAVAALRNVKNAAAVARLVMKTTDHILLVGEGALQFARAHGFEEQNLLTEKARKIWMYWKQTLSSKDDWLPPDPREIDPEVAAFFQLPLDVPPTPHVKPPVLPRPTGTIHCSAIDQLGNISCTTTTSGLAFKLPGRAGDSPIVGAGLYVDNGVGSCGATGRGEASLKNLASFLAVELMRQGAAPKEAGLEVLRRVVKNTTEPHLLDPDGTPNFNLQLYLLAKDGRYAGVSLQGSKDFSVTDASGTRYEACATLYNKPSASRDTHLEANVTGGAKD